MRIIDDWFTNRPLALLFEVKVNKGSLLISGVDFWNNLDKRLEAKQLLHSIKAYMSSSSFKPSVQVEESQIQALFEK